MFDRIVSWVHIGDLHVQTRDGQNYRDFERLIDGVNTHLLPAIDFAFLPGDNAGARGRSRDRAFHSGHIE